MSRAYYADSEIRRIIDTTIKSLEILKEKISTEEREIHDPEALFLYEDDGTGPYIILQQNVGAENLDEVWLFNKKAALRTIKNIQELIPKFDLYCDSCHKPLEEPPDIDDCDEPKKHRSLKVVK